MPLLTTRPRATRPRASRGERGGSVERLCAGLARLLGVLALLVVVSGASTARAQPSPAGPASAGAARAPRPPGAPSVAAPTAPTAPHRGPAAAPAPAAAGSAAASATDGKGEAFDPSLNPAPVVRIPATEAEKAEGSPIASIEISGNRRIANEDVMIYLREKVGQLFRMEAVSSDVRALWDSGSFDDIEVDLERKDTGVTLRFLVRERPNIKAIDFSGNEELDNDKLTEVRRDQGRTPS